MSAFLFEAAEILALAAGAIALGVVVIVALLMVVYGVFGLMDDDRGPEWDLVCSTCNRDLSDDEPLYWKGDETVECAQCRFREAQAPVKQDAPKIGDPLFEEEADKHFT